eukprot:1224664-Amphidinium_carterae.1
MKGFVFTEGLYVEKGASLCTRAVVHKSMSSYKGFVFTTRELWCNRVVGVEPPDTMGAEETMNAETMTMNAKTMDVAGELEYEEGPEGAAEVEDATGAAE